MKDAGQFDRPWVHTRLEYVSPLGAKVTHDYLAETGSKSIHRLHRVTVDPRDGSKPLEFDLELGPFGEEDE